jgi:hypothetical protein
VVGIKFLSATEATLFGQTTDEAGGGSGDMAAETYDPQGIAADNFARTNHTGEQAQSTVTGLVDALAAKADGAEVTALDGRLDTLESTPGGLLLPAKVVMTPVADCWRADGSRSAMPRTLTIASVSGDTITFTAAVGNTLGRVDTWTGLAYVRVWNKSKTPWEAAWVKSYASAGGTTITFSDAAHLVGWAAGNVVQLGDDSTSNALQMAAIDISPYLIANLGQAFRQKGVILSVYCEGTGGVANLAMSADGSGGSAVSRNSLSNGEPNQSTIVLPTSVLSPISDSNLMMFRETFTAPATAMEIIFARISGILV